MDNWCWAQWYMAIVIFINTVVGIISVIVKVAQRELTTGVAILGTILGTLSTVFEIYVLHAGGFW